MTELDIAAADGSDCRVLTQLIHPNQPCFVAALHHDFPQTYQAIRGLLPETRDHIVIL